MTTPSVSTCAPPPFAHSLPSHPQNYKAFYLWPDSTTCLHKEEVLPLKGIQPHKLSLPIPQMRHALAAHGEVIMQALQRFKRQQGLCMLLIALQWVRRQQGAGQNALSIIAQNA